MKLVEKILKEDAIPNRVYHGSGSYEVFKQLHDYQFYSVDYDIAADYAYNNGGLVYEIAPTISNPYTLIENRDNKPTDEKKFAGADRVLRKLFLKLYDENTMKRFIDRGFSKGLGFIILGNILPLAKHFESLGYDALFFMDEPFSAGYILQCCCIFKGNNAKIINVYEPELESGAAFNLIPYKVK